LLPMLSGRLNNNATVNYSLV